MDKNNVKLNGTPAERLTKSRKAAHLTQAELSRLSGYSIQHISRIENGKQRLTYDTAQELCKHLNVTPDYLLCKTVVNIETLENALYSSSDSYNDDVMSILHLSGISVDFDKLFKSPFGLVSRLNATLSPFDEEFVDLVNRYKSKVVTISIAADSNLNRKTIEVSQYSLITFISDVLRYIDYRSSEFIRCTGNKPFSEAIFQPPSLNE